jgi:hypothetical protein
MSRIDVGIQLRLCYPPGSLDTHACQATTFRKKLPAGVLLLPPFRMIFRAILAFFKLTLRLSNPRYR